MALARIISRSHECSRKLAIDLLARGYAVEIVSPDAIPDNIADLELRVESGPDNVLTASVETHNGGRKASLDFVHHLKAPMGDFIRRTPEPTEVVCRPEISGTSARQSILAPSPQLVPQASAELPDPDLPVFESTGSLVDTIRPPEEALPMIAASLLTAPKELPVAPPVAAPQELPATPERLSEPEEPRQAIAAVAAPLAMHKIERRKKKQARERSQGWFGRTAVTFAGVVLVALVAGFGMRHDATSSTSSAVASNSSGFNSNPFGIEERPITGSEMAVLAAAPTTSAAPAPPKHLAPAAPVDARNTKQRSARASNIAKPAAKAAAAKRHRQPSGDSNSDLVAPNTIVYFNQAAPKSVAAKKANRKDAHSPKPGDGVVAASKAPDLNAKPASNTAQQK